MSKYNVFLSPELRVKISNVEAVSQTEAIIAAEEWFAGSRVPSDIHDAVDQGPHPKPDTDEPYLEHVELSEDLSQSLVDNVGDEDFRESCWYTNEGGGPWRPGNEQRVLVLTACTEMGQEDWDKVIGVYKSEKALLKDLPEKLEGYGYTTFTIKNNWVYGESDGELLTIGYINSCLVQ